MFSASRFTPKGGMMKLLVKRIDPPVIVSAVLAHIHCSLEDLSHVMLRAYEGVAHGFTVDFGKRPQEASTLFADQHTADFFVQDLSRPAPCI